MEVRVFSTAPKNCPEVEICLDSGQRLQQLRTIASHAAENAIDLQAAAQLPVSTEVVRVLESAAMFNNLAKDLLIARCADLAIEAQQSGETGFGTKLIMRTDLASEVDRRSAVALDGMASVGRGVGRGYQVFMIRLKLQ